MVTEYLGPEETRLPLPAGSHVCWIVEDPAAYAAEAESFLAEASGTGERAIAFPAADRFPDPAPGPPLDPARLTRALRERATRARASGYRGLRLLADMERLHRPDADVTEIVDCEVILDRLADELNATIICAYPRWSFTAETLAGVLAVHSVLHGHDTEPRFRFVSSGAREWKLSGEVDLTVRSLFEAAFAAAVRLGDCAIDLSGLRFIDAGGVRAIASAAGNDPIQLRDAPHVLRRYWGLGGFARTAPGVRLVTRT